MDNYYKCRLCLEECAQNIDIFKEEDFSKMIELLTGLKVDPKDGLPTISCHQCHKEVKSAMLTRYQIINSYNILINELEVPNCDTKPSFVFGLLDKDYTIDHTNDNDAFEECDKKKIHHGQNTYTNHIVKNKSPDLLSELTPESKEFPMQKDYQIKIDNFFDPVQDSDENDKFDCSKSISININKNSDAETNLTETEKQGFKKISTRLRKKRKIVSQEIKFKRKRGRKDKSLQKKVQFKKKSVADPYFVKVDYQIKPEHAEFLKTVGKKDRVACPICQREMYGMNMRNHLITHNFDPVICDTCGKTSKNAQALQDHINYYHKTTPDRFMCDKCGKGYRVRFMLERHEKKEHGNGEKDYECTICGKKFFERRKQQHFILKVQLKNHINITHNKIKPFKCEHCGKDFGRRTQFVTHQLVHTKENRYHCQVCGKGFKIKQTLQTHLKGVHGIEEEKTIFCKICQKGFSSAQGLRAHVNSRVHGLEKCEHCSEFITFEYKHIHLKEIHGIEPQNVFS